MQLITGNIFYPYTYKPKLSKRVDAWCIPTNGFVRRDGTCVMGRGIAKQAAELIPTFPKALGEKIQKEGNTVHDFIFDKSGKRVSLVTFPVKPKKDAFTGNNAVSHMLTKFKIGDIVPGWACKAQLSIIKRSCEQLKKLVEDKNWHTVIVPQVGCGAGELDWSDVRPVLEEHFDDRFYCIKLMFAQRTVPCDD